MSWFKGTAWKTPWRRRRPQVPPTTLTGVWAFNAFQNGGTARYELPLVAPAPARTLPFWVGMLAVVSDPASALSPLNVGNSDGTRGIIMSAFSGVDQAPGPFSRITELIIQEAPVDAFHIVKPGLGTARQAIACLLEAHAISGTEYIVNYWVDKFVAAARNRNSPYNATTVAFFMRPNGYALNGVAAGNIQPTEAEIAAWFEATKAAGEVQAISGKTSDRWTATSAAPLVPDPLPNLAGGQVADLMTVAVPVPVNTLFQVAFGY